jgi:uncharacterized protein YciI
MGVEAIPVVAYFLVLLRPGPTAADAESDWAEHVAFIDLMIERNVVLLGGEFGSPVGGAVAAYLLHTTTRSEAESWARRDPVVRDGRMNPEIIEWRLVGINPRAIEPSLL